MGLWISVSAVSLHPVMASLHSAVDLLLITEIECLMVAGLGGYGGSEQSKQRSAAWRRQLASVTRGKTESLGLPGSLACCRFRDWLDSTYHTLIKHLSSDETAFCRTKLHSTLKVKARFVW